MKHLKKFENFQSINEEEEIVDRVSAWFGKFNDHSIKSAENLLSKTEKDNSLKTKNKQIIDFKNKEFQEYKSLYKKGDKEGTELFKQIVQHIVTNNDLVYRIEEIDGKKVFRKGMRYGREGGTGAAGGS